MPNPYAPRRKAERRQPPSAVSDGPLEALLARFHRLGAPPILITESRAQMAEATEEQRAEAVAAFADVSDDEIREAIEQAVEMLETETNDDGEAETASTPETEHAGELITEPEPAPPEPEPVKKPAAKKAAPRKKTSG